MKRTTTLMVILGLLVSLLAVPAFAQDATPTVETTPEATMETTMEATAEATTEDTMEESAEVEGPTAYLRVLHLVPDAGAVDVYLNGELSDIQGSEYVGESEWHAVPTGTHTVAVTSAGSMVEEAIASTEVTLNEDDFVTLAVVSDAEGTPSVQVILSDFSEQLPGVAVLNFVNALNGSRSVNFLRDDVPFVTGLAPSASTASEIDNSIPVDVDTYTFSVEYSDTEEPVAVDSVELDVVATDNYLFVVSGTEESPELTIYETSRGDIRVLTGEIEAPGTIVEALAAENLATVSDALAQTGLADTLSGEGPYTVFIPADYLQDELSASSEDLTTLLQNHVVEGDLKLSDLVDMGSVTTLAGNTLDVTTVDNTVMIGDVAVLTTNIAATNGTIHIIDGILSTSEDDMAAEEDMAMTDEATMESTVVEPTATPSG